MNACFPVLASLSLQAVCSRCHTSFDLHLAPGSISCSQCTHCAMPWAARFRPCMCLPRVIVLFLCVFSLSSVSLCCVSWTTTFVFRFCLLLSLAFSSNYCVCISKSLNFVFLSWFCFLLAFLHSTSSQAGYFDLENLLPFDLLPISLSLSCLTCSEDTTVRSLLRGARKQIACKSCKEAGQNITLEVQFDGVNGNKSIA